MFIHFDGHTTTDFSVINHQSQLILNALFEFKNASRHDLQNLVDRHRPLRQVHPNRHNQAHDPLNVPRTA